MANIYTITSPRNDRVFIHVMAGHFISTSNHINYYIGTSDVKHNHEVSVDTAMLLAEYYVANDIQIDTVLCLYETQALGAYLAHELARPNMLSPNPDQTVFVVGSEYDAAGNLIFRDNLRRMINGKNVLVLISCITSGRTVERAIESVSYYGGKTVGVSAVFSAVDEVYNVHVNSIFTTDDVPNYKSFNSHSCPLCQQGLPVDAIANGYGYSKI
jgi:orotate phosphoribosyltransferase